MSFQAGYAASMSHKDKCNHHTGSCEGSIEAVKVLPLPFWTIMFDDLFCAEVIASMCGSGQVRNKTFSGSRSVKTMRKWKIGGADEKQ